MLGDWSPKNLLVYPDRVLALDFEVAHRGDPAFDVAFLLTHLVMKSVHLPARRDAPAECRRRVPRGIRRRPFPSRESLAELGCLLLARVDGKSPAEYLTEPERETARALAYDAPARPARARWRRLRRERPDRLRPRSRDPRLSRTPDRRGRARALRRHDCLGVSVPSGASTGRHEAVELPRRRPSASAAAACSARSRR